MKKIEITTSELKTNEYSLYNSSNIKTIEFDKFSTIPETRVEKNFIRENIGYITTGT